MQWWQLEAASSAVIAGGYFGIFLLIAVPVTQAGQLRSNKLATATAAIFFSCAIGHFFHFLEALRSGDMATMSIPWWLALWDTTTAVVAVYYLTLRRSYGRLLLRAPLFDDLKERERLSELEKLQAERVRATAAIEQARDAALASTAAKSAFLATMSHEIRTPMNAVIGSTDLLLDTPLSEQQQELVNTVRMSGDSLLALINDILDFSKIESGEMHMESEPFDFRDEVEGCLDLVSAAATAKGLDLICYVEEGCPARAVGDSARLRQILVNLLSNAVKFTADGEVLMTVGAAEDGGRLRVTISVTDTGIGISPEGLARLFTSFTQVDASTTRVYGGTGLGLAISRRLAQAMGGDVAVVSSPGAGSTFTVTLLLDPAPESGDQPAPPTAAPDLTGVSVLLVDDNLTCLRILDLQLTGLGTTCTTVSNPVTALEMVRGGHTYDIAIVDMRMPGLDGVHLARALRDVPAVAAKPLVLLTGVGTRPTDALATFDAYLAKPVKSLALRESLRAALSGRLEERPSPAETGRSAAIAPMGTMLRVLLAEDNVVNQRVAQLMLDKLGQHVDTVADGAAAVEAVQRATYDVILMDVQMPHMDGLEATRRIRALALPGRQPQIVAMTANAMAEERHASGAAGMQDYLPKPVRVQDLRAVLERVVEDLQQQDSAGHADGVVDEVVPAGASAPLPVAAAGVEAASLVDNRPAVDHGVLDELGDQLGDGGGAVLASLIRDYLAEGPGHVARLLCAAQAGDAETVASVAHAFRSTSALLGADPLADLLEAAEESARRSPIDLGPVTAPVEAEYARVVHSLERRVAVSAL